MKVCSQIKEIEILIRARYPIIYLVSWEEKRVVDMLLHIAQRAGKKVNEWTCSGGMVPAGTMPQQTKNRDASTRDPLVALNSVFDEIDPAIYIFKDFHAFLANNNFTIIRKLRDIACSLQASYKTVIILSPFLRIPPELEKEVTVVDFKLPGLNELGALLDGIVDEVKDNPKITIDLDSDSREHILKAALGLTLNEAENVFAKALVSGGKLCRDDVTAIFAEKQQIIRKTGLLDYCEHDTNMQQVGGLDSLKEWAERRNLAFSDNARHFGLPAPKGVLLLGVQGCGKSLCAKAVSALWRLPLLRFDMGRMFSSLVGSSEENVRRAISIAESIAPCIMWIDEIDKAFGALSGSSTDSGTSQRVLGTLLTWMAEKSSPVFVIATANNISVLPPELMRKGRFDEIFFVDLPCRRERTDIFTIHLKTRGRVPSDFDLQKLVDHSDGFSGAEIEQAVISALFDAFYAGRDITTDDIVETLKQSVPLSVTMEENIRQLRHWAKHRARLATSPEELTGDVSLHGRRVEL